jgi:hypothetical protein
MIDDCPKRDWDSRRELTSNSPERRLYDVLEEAPLYVRLNLAIAILEYGFRWMNYGLYDELNHIRERFDDLILLDIARKEND